MGLDSGSRLELSGLAILALGHAPGFLGGEGIAVHLVSLVEPVFHVQIIGGQRVKLLQVVDGVRPLSAPGSLSRTVEGGQVGLAGGFGVAGPLGQGLLKRVPRFVYLTGLQLLHAEVEIGRVEQLADSLGLKIGG